MLTDLEVRKAIQRAKRTSKDVYLSEKQSVRGTGRLRVRARPSEKAIFYFRYATSNGKRGLIRLGTYSENGKNGITLKTARQKANALSGRYQDGVRYLGEVIAHEQAEERDRVALVARERAEAKRQAVAGTLRVLLTGYTNDLIAQGKRTSGQDAHNLFRLNIYEAFPHIAERRACEITREDVSKMLAGLIDRGAGRTAAKMRSYMRAAFETALRAGSDPTVPQALHGFNIGSNPVAAVPARALTKFNRVRERTLSEPELCAFMDEVAKLPESASRDALMLCLLLGGQRPTQLLRLMPEHVDMHAKEITLFDSKGARSQPRAHTLPLTDRAGEIVTRLLSDHTNRVKNTNGPTIPWLFTDTGRAAVRADGLSHIVNNISKTILKSGTARAPFELRDIRRTCETMLAKLGISKDVRARILSHGIGGVQDRHYDMHSYSDEKRIALEAWDATLIKILTGSKQDKKVVNMRTRGMIGP